jgi:hypothetical protein
VDLIGMNAERGARAAPLMEESRMNVPALHHTKNPATRQVLFAAWSRAICWGMIVWSLLVSPGCTQSRMFQNPFRREAACVLSPDPSLPEVVAHLNNNISRVQAWRSTDVSIRTLANGMPVTLSASIAVQQTRNFRLLARSPFGEEAVLGSNDERFWFWMNRNDPHALFTVRHDEISLAQQRVNIPFQPDWLLEVLGVIPIIPTEIELQPDLTDSGVLSLVSERTSPSGQPVRRVILVDKCHGHTVAHSLYDASNQLIAKAELGNYQLDPATGAMLPHRISLEWPQAGLGMTMSVGSLEVNPLVMPAQFWEVPRTPNIQPVDLAR